MCRFFCQDSFEKRAMTFSRSISACAIALFLLAATPQTAHAQYFEPSFEEGLAAFNYGDNDLAARHFWRLAGMGDAKAQYYLAYTLDTGLGMGKDVVAAARWYKKSADQNYLPAVVYMGYIYSTGHGVTRDDKEAFKWYAKAANMGDAIAQNNLASMLRAGHPYRQDLEIAAKWFYAAALQGNTRAQYNLATMYRKGEGVPQNGVEALKWYTFAANQGDVYAQNVLGFLYLHGIGVDKDENVAIDWYRRAAEQGHEPSMMSLARLYEEGKGGGNEEYVATWYLRAAQEGSSYAKYRIGMMFLEGRGQFKQDVRQAVDMLTKAAEEDGYAPAMVAMARLRQEQKSLSEAQLWYERAVIADEPSLAAAIELGNMAEKAGNPVEALKWYMIAHEYSQKMGTTDQKAVAVKKRVELSNTLPEDVVSKAQQAVLSWKREKTAAERREARRAQNQGKDKKPAYEYE